MKQLQIKIELNDQLFRSYYSAGYNLEHQLVCIRGIDHGNFALRELLRTQLEMDMR